MKTRKLYTKLWNDPWFEDLGTSDKILFIYLLTNSYVNLPGIYELSDKRILSETGLNTEQLARGKDRLKEKVLFVDSWIIIKNVEKYDNYAGGKLEIAKNLQLKEIPEAILDTASKFRDTLSIQYPYPIHTPNSNSNSNIRGIVKGEKKNPYTDPEFLNTLSIEDVASIKKNTSATDKQVLSKAEDIYNWYKSNPKKNKRDDWRAVLRNAVKRDYPTVSSSTDGYKTVKQLREEGSAWY